MKRLDTNIDPVTRLDYSVVRRCSPPSYASLTRIKHDDGSIQLVSDISLLLHERDIAGRYGMETFNSILSEFSPRDGSLLNSYRKKYTDEELMNSVKPRNIQTPSELRLWFRYLNATADIENKLKEQEDSNENDSSTSNADSISSGLDTSVSVQ